MPDGLAQFLADGWVADEVFAIRPDYRVMLIGVTGLVPSVGDEASETLLGQAETAAREALSDRLLEQLPHVAAWRQAYRDFGAKPQRTRSSLEALLRRVDSGLPRVNRLTDLYNAVSVRHQIPIGGEDLTRYCGPPRLIRATGAEPFDTVANGNPVVEYPVPGEVVWCDSTGVTCRRWNWRQGRRTQLTDTTTTALFILDALDPITCQDLMTATDELANQLTLLGSEVRLTRRLITAEGD